MASDKKLDPNLVYGHDGKPLLSGGKPIRQDLYDDYRDSNIEEIKAIAADRATKAVIGKALGKR